MVGRDFSEGPQSCARPVSGPSVTSMSTDDTTASKHGADAETTEVPPPPAGEEPGLAWYRDMTDQPDKDLADPNATQAALGEESETVVVDSHTISVDRAELAWSVDETDVEPKAEHQSWTDTWKTTAMILACAALVAAMAGGLFWAWHAVNRPSAAPPKPSAVVPPPPSAVVPPPLSAIAPPTPAPASTPTAAAPTLMPAPTSTPVLSDTDRQFLGTLRNRGVNYPYSNPDYPISHAHAVCDYMNTHQFVWGEDHEGSVDKYVETTTIWYGADAVEFQGLARATYCPSTVNGQY